MTNTIVTCCARLTNLVIAREQVRVGDFIVPHSVHLHTLAMDVVGEGFVSKAAGMFDLADDLSLEVSGVLEALERVQGALESLVELRPNQLEEEDA